MPNTQVMIGVALSVGACFVNALGLNVQRYAKVHKRGGLNVGGVVLSACAGILDMVSFSFAPQSMLAPLGALTLVCNMLLASLFDKTASLSRWDYFGTGIIISGVVKCVLSSLETPEADAFDGPGLVAFVTRRDALAYVGTVAALVAALVALMRSLEAGARARGGCVEPPFAAVYPAIAGALCSLTVLGAKFSGEVVKAGGPAAAGWPAFGAGWAATIGGAVGQAFFLNRGLGQCGPLLVVPVFSACAVLFNTAGGAFFWGELSAWTAAQARAVPVACLCVCGGVYVLVSKATQKERAEKAAAAKKKE